MTSQLQLYKYTMECCSSSKFKNDVSRGHLEVTDTNADLMISPVEMVDGGEYRSGPKPCTSCLSILPFFRCEITYLDVSHNCPVIHRAKLRTIGNDFVI